MLTKLSTFSGVSSEGEPLVRAFRQGDSIQKVAGLMMPDVRDWLGTYRSDSKYIAVLVNALGGSEYWGQNSNGDVFPWSALTHDCRTCMPHPIDDFIGRRVPPYGYRTFLEALPFVHHRNKDPSRAFGKVAVSCLNPKMKRVELVVLVARELARQFDAGHVIDKLEQGLFPDVSMGCRVPYDVCTICGHKSRTKNDYCEHVRDLGLGRLLEDGRRVGLINTYPRFFDISFVYIGADKTAKVMMKFAEKAGLPQSIVDGERLYVNQREWEGLMKAASDLSVPELGVGVDLDQKTPATLIDECVREHGIIPPRLQERFEAWRASRPHSLEHGGMEDGYLNTNAGDMNELDSDKLAEETRVNLPVIRRQRQVVEEDLHCPHCDRQIPERFGVFSPDGENFVCRACDGPLTFSKTAAERLSLSITISGNREAVESVEKTLAAAQALGSWGASRTIRLGIDGDGADRLKVEGVRKADGKTFNKLIDADEIHAHQVKLAEEKKLQAPPHREDFPYHGKYKFKGLEILVENKKGTWRVGKGWKTLMRHDYGEIAGSHGADGDPVDVYIGPNESSDEIFIVHQNFVFGPKKGTYDEDKVMLGFKTLEEAKRAYLSHYDNPAFLRSVTHMTFAQFKKMIFGESKGEKLAEELTLDDLFTGARFAQRRERRWTDKATGKTTHHTGSGLGQSYDELKQKTGGAKHASHRKLADIDKEIEPSGSVGRVAAVLSRREDVLPSAVLDAMAKCSLQDALATPAMMGISLRPEEFQRLFLHHLGQVGLSGDVEGERAVFAPTAASEPACEDLGIGNFNPRIMRMLLPHLRGRSYMTPILVRRIERLNGEVPPPTTTSPSTNSLLTKVGAAYNWYRKQMAKVAATNVPSILAAHPELKAGIFGISDESLFSKEAANAATVGAIASIPLALMYSSSLRDSIERGEDVDFFRRLIAEHPYLAALGSAALSKQLLRHPAVEQAIERAAHAAP